MRRDRTAQSLRIVGVLALALPASSAGAFPRLSLHLPVSARIASTPAAPVAPVADAAMRGDAAAVRALLAKGSDVNGAQGDGMTALHWAASRGDVPLATLLLRAKANVKATTRIGAYTPLHVASQGGSAPIVKALLASGADARAVTTDGVSALHLAAMGGDAAVVHALVAAGADVNASEPLWGQTPLMVASARGRAPAVRALLARGATPDLRARTIDPMASSAQDRQAKNTRNAVLAQLREAQGKAKDPNWQPDARQVQAAVQAARATERESATATALASAAAASAAEEARLAAQGGPGLDDDSPGYTELLGPQGGHSALLLAVREGHAEVIAALLDGGASVNLVSAGDHTSPLLMAAINGQYDAAMALLARGADPNLASDAGAAPLYGILNKEWAPSTRTPQPAYQLQQKATYLEVMAALLKAKADPNARLKRSLWYTTYNRDNLRVDFTGATPFFRAAYATDVAAMKLLLAAGADPKIGTIKPVARARRGGGGAPREDPSGLPPVPDGGPGVLAIHAASGVGYGQGFAANDHRHVPDGWLPSVKFLIEELGADVNARDFSGYTPLHHAAARGDNEMIKYLVSKGADVTAVARTGQTTADMANGPVQRISPYLDTVKLLESLGSKNNHKCVSC
ncbi:MAG: ankyrin repeat domain-containing protein [Gemmatimonadaceae bacterium]|nr:ankyrin repeat domain-containing protein [Gemmatimonadota bacterium]MBP9105267.1 ankyrin repeat domain-containing protein [Gemmatimonadaceae bacterium]